MVKKVILSLPDELYQQAATNARKKSLSVGLYLRMLITERLTQLGKRTTTKSKA